MLHVDLPTLADIRALAALRQTPSVSLVLPTTPITAAAQADRITFADLVREAIAQVDAAGVAKREIWPLEEQFDDLHEDDEFWAHQARSLVVLATPDSLQTFRLANALGESVEVSDRFNLVPLIRSVTFPHHALVLVLTEGGAQVFEVTADAAANPVRVPNMPVDAATVAGRASLSDRSPKGRIQGSEGKKVHLRAYARHVDAALRPFLQGRDTPLALIASEPMASIFRSVCTHPILLTDMPAGATPSNSTAEITTATRAMLDAYHARRVAEFGDVYAARADARRATDRVTDVARAATFGLVDTLAVNMDADLPGLVSEEDGAVTYADEASADSYNILGEIAARALLTGARVVAARQADLPGETALAALLRRPV